MIAFIGSTKNSKNFLDFENGIKRTFEGLIKEKIATSKPGMHNIRSAGQMWPAKAFHLARKANNFAYLACLFPKKQLLKVLKHVIYDPCT